MKKRTDVTELSAHIKKTLLLIEKNFSFYQDFNKTQFNVLGKSTSAAMVLSQVFTDFYTCLETLFHRVSQFFENSIDKNRWHKELLVNMTLEIEGIRPALISDKTAAMLDEILRFRHFRRYYFEMEYDWDRIDLIKTKYLNVIPRLEKELTEFRKFLEKV